MKRLAMIVAAVAIGFSFTACGSQGADTGDATPVQVNDVQKVPVKGTDDTIIYDVTMNDGTHCFITDGHNSGGIWCESDAPVTP